MPAYKAPAMKPMPKMQGMPPMPAYKAPAMQSMPKMAPMPPMQNAQPKSSDTKEQAPKQSFRAVPPWQYARAQQPQLGKTMPRYRQFNRPTHPFYIRPTAKAWRVAYFR